MPGWHTIIRGLAPQAGGFRRRPNKPSSVGLSAWLIVVVGRLPCVLQVVAATCSSVSYPNTCQTCNPGSDPVASHAQYITNKPRRIRRAASLPEKAQIRSGLKAGLQLPHSQLITHNLSLRPSPCVYAPSRPSVCVRCPRHEYRLRGSRIRPCGATRILTTCVPLMGDCKSRQLHFLVAVWRSAFHSDS